MRLVGVVILVAVLVALPADAHMTVGGLNSVYVANWGQLNQPTTGSIGRYAVSADGALTPKQTFALAWPEAVAVTAQGKSVLVPSYNDPGKVVEYDVSDTGIYAAHQVASGSRPVNVAVSPDGKSAYVANHSDDTVSEYDVSADGSIHAKSPPFAYTPDAPTDFGGMAISPNGKYVYVSIEGGAIAILDIGAGGVLSKHSPWSFSAPGFHSLISFAFNPDGQTLYAVDDVALGNVWVLGVDANGNLSVKTQISEPRASNVAVSPDGNNVYVTNNRTNGFVKGSVLQFDVAANGTLSPKNPASVPTPDDAIDSGIAVSPDGNSVYVADYSGNIAQYDVGAGGKLSPKSSPLVSAGIGPQDIAVSPNQGPVAAFSSNAAVAGSASSFDGTGSSDSDGSVAKYAWDFGDGATGTGASPTHAFTAAGTYMVTLTVTDNAGCSTGLVYTGRTLSCNGGAAANITHSITVTAPAAKPGTTTSAASTSATTTSAATATTTTTTSTAGKSKASSAAAGAFTKAPVLSALKLAPPAFRKGKGTSAAYRDSVAAKTSFTVLQTKWGVRHGKRCVIAKRQTSRAGSHCKTAVTVARFAHRDAAGANRLRLGAKLRPGAYTLKARATADGRTSAPVVATFRVRWH